MSEIPVQFQFHQIFPGFFAIPSPRKWWIPEGKLFTSSSQNSTLAENTAFETTVRGTISHTDESGKKFLRILGNMNTENYSGFVREKITFMLLRNENKATVSFLLCHLSVKNPMPTYGRLSLSTHTSLTVNLVSM